MNRGLGAYKKTSIHTASKEQILLMLYQAAIKNCKKAIEAIETNNISAKGEHIGKMQDIIIELHNSLDFKVGGEIATELSSLYDYLIFASTQANIKIDASHLEGCLNVLTTLYDGWTKAVKEIRNTNTGTAEAPK